MNLKDKLDDAVKDAARMTREFKKSYIPIGGYTIIQFYTTFCSYDFNQDVYFGAGGKHTFYLSNVPGFVKPVKYFGQYAKRFFTFGSGCGNCATAFVVVSMPERAQISLTSDDTQIENVPLFMSYIDEILIELGI